MRGSAGRDVVRCALKKEREEEGRRGGVHAYEGEHDDGLETCYGHGCGGGRRFRARGVWCSKVSFPGSIPGSALLDVLSPVSFLAAQGDLWYVVVGIEGCSECESGGRIRDVNLTYWSNIS